jgi:hypothetical protein
MNRTAIPVLLLAIAFGASVQAQPRAGMSHGGGHFGGRVVVGIRGVHGFEHRGFHRHAFDSGFGAGFVPFWWDEPFGYNSYGNEGTPPPEEPVTPPMIIMRDGPSPPASAATPKLIEVPLSPNTAPSPQATAVFVLKDGTRIEPQRYLVTADNAYLIIERRQRTIPLSQLDIAATVSANRERGIELRIPIDRNEISLSF